MSLPETSTLAVLNYCHPKGAFAKNMLFQPLNFPQYILSPSLSVNILFMKKPQYAKRNLVLHGNPIYYI